MYLKLFKDTDDGLDYFINDQNYHCNSCKGELSNLIIIQTIYYAKSSEIKLFCQNCIRKVMDLGIVNERIKALVVSKPPKKSVPRILSPPSISSSSSRETVFSAVSLHSDYVEDHAWRSKVYPSLDGATIGKPLSELDNLKDKELKSEKVVDAILNNILKSVPVIEETKKPLLDKQQNGDQKAADNTSQA